MTKGHARAERGDLRRADAGAETRILIVKSSSLGDIVLALPTLRALRRAYPRAYLAWVVESPFQDLLHGNGDLDRVFVVETDSVGRIAASLWKTIREIRSDAFDVVLDLQGWIKSQTLCLLSGARSMVGIKKKNELGFHILRRGVTFRAGAHMADLCLDVARLLGAGDSPIVFDVPVFDADRAYVDRFVASLPLGRGAGIAVLQPGTTWTNKRWSPAKLADVGRALAASGVWVPVVLRGPGDEAHAAEVARLIGLPAVISPPTTLRQMAALIQRSGLYVGVDSGPMHLASAFGVPTVALFGPSDSSRFGPYQQPAAIVRREMPCSPCGEPTCRLGTVECMTSIGVQDVMDAIRRVGTHAAFEP